MELLYLYIWVTGLGRFNICVHAELYVHETVTAGANLHCLIYNLVIAIVFPTYFGITSEYQQVG